MIMGYVKCVEGLQALELFGQIRRGGVNPDCVTFVAVVSACARGTLLQEGRRAHEQIIQRGYVSNIYVGSSLVDMYAKCGSIADAERVFNGMSTRNVVAWNAMIQGYARCGEGCHALKLYQQMQLEGVDPNTVTFLGVLNGCASVAALEEGKCAHEQIIQRVYESDALLRNSLIDMYAKCWRIDYSERVFNEIPTRNVVAWNALIQGYVKCGEGSRALELYRQMQSEGVDPNPVTFVAVLNACASLAARRHAHEQIIQRGYESDVFVANSLIDMYAKCGCLEDCERVFNEISTRDVVAWTAMIQGYMKCGEGRKALELPGQMQKEGLDPDPVTFVALLTACASIAVLKEGRHVHEQIIQRGYESDVYVRSSLIDMYAKCGSIDDAEWVFKEVPTRAVVVWNAMLAGYGWQDGLW